MRPNLRRVHVHFVYAYVILILVLCGVSCPLIFPRKTMFGSSLLAFVLYVVHALFVLHKYKVSNTISISDEVRVVLQ